jgi:chromosome partitioning protein
MTRTNPLITSKIEREIYKSLANAEVPLMRTRLHERQAYKAIFVRKLALHELDASINGLEAAKQNATTLAEEVIDLIAENQAAGREEHAHV